MTQQEAEALAARLMRIWSPQSADEVGLKWKFYSSTEEMHFEVSGPMTRHVRFIYFHVKERRRTYEGYLLSLRVPTANNNIADLVYRLDWTTPRESVNNDPEDYYPDQYDAEEHDGITKEFFAQWTPFFRRNCWLSGCPIEATAHEKAEWLHGFTTEEIEAWKLKM